MPILQASSERVLEDGLAERDRTRPRPPKSVGDVALDGSHGDGKAQVEPGEDSENKFLSLARDSFRESTDFLTGFVQKNWSRDLDHFMSKHASDSRYISEAYRARSRLFRPKTRAMVRKGEADCARAFFSTQEVVNIAPVDDARPEERASADIVDAILNHRLTKKIPWFRILQGQFQTANVMGICCSKQYWVYEEKEETTDRYKVVTDDAGNTVFEDDGNAKFEKERVTKVIKDDLVIEPVPPENMRVHPGSDWLDPIKTSPYVIYRFPMYLMDVKAKSKEVDPKTGQPSWYPLKDGLDYTGAMVDADTLDLRAKRDGGGDRMQRQVQVQSRVVTDQDLVWVHENIIRHDGKDWQYYTLGVTQLLSPPRPMEEVYQLGERPFVWGVGQIEAFRLVPQSKVGMLFDLQVRANHLENLRLDNVFQSLEPKVLVKAASNIDLRALTSSRVGGVVQVPGNPKDVVEFIRPPDVTSSSYHEQNLLNLDMDDIGGAFSASSVASNRQLNETVGGMNLLSGNANTLVEYDLRIFAETWVEPVLRQCVKLVQRYETDTNILALAGKKAQIYQRYGMDPMVDDLLNGELTTTVNVGLGAANPEQRLKRFMSALGAVLQVGEPLVKVYGPGVVQSAGFQAITQEVFGLAGYKDGLRFMDFNSPGEGQQPPQQGQGQPGMDPQMMQQMQQLGSENAQLHQEVANKQMETQADLQMETMKQKGETERTVLKMRGEQAIEKQKMDMQAKQQQQDSLMKLITDLNRPPPAAGPMGQPQSDQRGVPSMPRAQGMPQMPQMPSMPRTPM